MKKRLRKKLRLREFQEFLFHVRLDLTVLNTNEAYNAFMDKLFPMIEGNGLLINGTITDFYVQPEHHRLATEADRQLLRIWLAQQPEIVGAEVGPLVDAWRGRGSYLSRPGDELPGIVVAHVLTQAGIEWPK